MKLYGLINEHVLHPACNTGDTQLSALTGSGQGSDGDCNETGLGLLLCSERLIAVIANIV